MYGKAEIQFENIESESGFLFLEEAVAHASYSTYRIVYYVNVSSFYELLPRMMNQINHTREICIKIEDEACSGVMDMLESQIMDAEEKDQVILKAESRKRRGLCDVCGELFSATFGLMSKRREKEVMTSILQLQSVVGENREVIGNQTAFMEANINLTRKAFTEINDRLEIMSNTLSKVNTLVDSLLGKSRSKAWTQDSVQLATLALIEHNTMAERIRGCLDHARIGALAGIIPLGQLNHDLAEITMNLGRNRAFPVDVRKEDAARIFKYVNIKAALNRELMLLEVEIPIVRDEIYFLYRAFPIPVVVNDNVLIALPKTEYFLLNADRNRYIELTTEQVRKGMKMETGEVIFRPTTATLKRSQDVCLWRMLVRPEVSEFKRLCNIGMLPSSTYVFTMSGNDLYYIFSRESFELEEQCEDMHMQSYILNGSGILRLNKGCSIHTTAFALEPHDQLTFNSSKIITPRVNKGDMRWTELNNFTHFWTPVRINHTEDLVLIQQIRELDELSENMHKSLAKNFTEIKWLNLTEGYNRYNFSGFSLGSWGNSSWSFWSIFGGFSFTTLALVAGVIYIIWYVKFAKKRNGTSSVVNNNFELGSMLGQALRKRANSKETIV